MFLTKLVGDEFFVSIAILQIQEDGRMEQRLLLRIAVIGLGLIGGSLALGLRKYTNHTVVGFDCCPETMKEAVRSGAVTTVASEMKEAAAESDVVFLALAPGKIISAVRQIAPVLKAGAIVTDVASAKGTLAEEIGQLLPQGVSYIAGHPMAGSEKIGFAAAVSDMFLGRPYILMNDDPRQGAALETMVALVKELKAQPVFIDSTLHDPAVAAISHVPHIAAASLAILGGEGEQGQLQLQLAAGGFRDGTRVAGGNPAMWADICVTNRKAVVDSLDQFQQILNQVRHMVASADEEGLRSFLGRAKAARDRYQRQSSLMGGNE